MTSGGLPRSRSIDSRSYGLSPSKAVTSDLSARNRRSSHGRDGPSSFAHTKATSNSIKELPRGTTPVRFIGEGAANAVFEIQVPVADSSATQFKGLLLRVAKVPQRGQKSKYDYLFQQNFFEKSILPVLGKYAVHQELVGLRHHDIIEEMNNLLASLDIKRKKKFRGSYIGESEFGLLVEDMTPKDSDHFTVEFKPKWLAQSPSAPANAIRCRQCALELRYFITNPSGDRPLPIDKPCPLTLCDDGGAALAASPFRLAPELATSPAREYIAKRLVNITKQPIMKELRRQQMLHDTTGPLTADPKDADFALAMTIRDCTCFAQISLRPAVEIEDGPLNLRFGDLDWKNPAHKISHWRGLEAALINDGFYTASRIQFRGDYYNVPTLCALEMSSDCRPPTTSVLYVDEEGKSQRQTRSVSAQGVHYIRTADVDEFTHRLLALKDGAVTTQSK